MPRPKPPEALYPRSFRFTRKQLLKIEQMGGGKWLRALVSKTQASRHGRDPIAHARALKARNLKIAADRRPSQDVAQEHKLSRQQVNAIRRQYRVSPSPPGGAAHDNGGEKENR